MNLKNVKNLGQKSGPAQKDCAVGRFICISENPKPMDPLEEFKQRVFSVMNGLLPLADFEQWLYRNEALSDLMDNDAILMVYEFDYGKADSKYEFNKLFLKEFGDEFLLWKVKANLTELINGTHRTELIISDFYTLGDQGYSWAYSIGYYEYLLDNSLYDYGDSNDVLNNLKTEAAQLLSLIMDQEKGHSVFKLSDFHFPSRDHLAVKPKFDANFWK